VGSARFNAVLGTDWYVDFLLAVAIVISQKETVTSIRILEPAFKGSRHALTAFARRLMRKRLRRERCSKCDARYGGPQSGEHHLRESEPAAGSLCWRSVTNAL